MEMGSISYTFSSKAWIRFKMNYFLSGPSGIKPSVMNWLGIHPSRKLNILSLAPNFCWTNQSSFVASISLALK